MFSDKKRVGACVEQPLDVLPAVQAAFDHKEPVIRNERGKPDRGFDIHVERFQIAIVDADDGCAGVEGFSKFRFIVNLNQRVELQISGELDEFLQFARLQHRDDQQNRARPGRACLINLERIEDEVLAENRDA